MYDGVSAPPPGQAAGLLPAPDRPSALLDWFSRTVETVMRPDPSVVVAGTTLLAVLAVLRRSDEPAALVVDALGRAVGMIDADSLLEVMFEADPATPVERAMHGNEVLCVSDSLLHRETARMRRERRRMLGVIDPAGRPVGLLTRQGTLAPLLAPVADFLDHVEHSTAADRARVAASLVADRQHPVAIQAALGVLNDRLMERILRDSLRSMEADGWGEPPVPFTLLIMGSGGRQESFLHPDQDNGFILADYPDAMHAAVDRWFIQLAERFTRALDAAGFPLCRGNVMASNPVWRKSVSQWRAQVAGWAHRRSPQSVLWADIFLDFRAIGGAAGFGDELREAVLQVCADYPLYLKMLSWHHVQQTVPLGLFGQLLGEPGAAHHDEIDLKLRATLPFIGLIRMMALRNGVPATGTLARLRALVGMGKLSEEFGAVLEDDFAELTALRMRQQLAGLAEGKPPSNHLKLVGLGERDRKRLVRVFRSIDMLRKVAAQEFGGRTG